MAYLLRRLGSRTVQCALLVALCFALTSAVYLSWLYRLVALAGSGAADWLSMVAGYLFQAAGMAITAHALKRRPGSDTRRQFQLALLAFAIFSVPSVLAGGPAGAIIFGFLMNLSCGLIAGFYLCAIAREVDAACRGLVFGAGYALATVAVGLLALPAGGNLMRDPNALVFYLSLCAFTAAFAWRMELPGPLEKTSASVELAPAEEPWPLPGKTLALACAAITMVSLVKNLGFVFPSADIEAGLKPELSRIPYAAGLLAAGFINDRSRRNGLVCTIAAMIIPFIMLGIADEPVSSAICWGLDYLFFGFFSVFRAVLLLDIAARARRWELAPVGLLMGRVGDALGSMLGILLANNRLVLISLAAVLFFAAVYLCFQLYQRLYAPKALQARSEHEVFEAFCAHHDLSAREKDILRMIIDRHTNGEIAMGLFISENTVKYHVRNVLQKTGCKNRGELQDKYKAALYPHLEGIKELISK